MFARKLLGVVVTAEKVSIASLSARSRSKAVCAMWTTRLPAGCVNETTGSLQLADRLVEVIRGVPLALGLRCSSSRVSLVLPRQLFFTESWLLTQEQQASGSETILAEAQRRLPGDRNEVHRACHWRKSPLAGYAPAAMMVAARCLGIEGYLAAMDSCGAQLDTIASPEIARFNLLCLVRSDSMNKSVLCVTRCSSILEYEVWIGGVLMYTRSAPREALMTSLMVPVFQEQGAGVSQHADRGGIQPLDYIAVFDERSRVEAEDGLNSLHELCQVSGAELLYPTEYVERESNANSTVNWSESVGALAPYCRQLEIASLGAKVVLQ